MFQISFTLSLWPTVASAFFFSLKGCKYYQDFQIEIYNDIAKSAFIKLKKFTLLTDEL